MAQTMQPEGHLPLLTLRLLLLVCLVLLGSLSSTIMVPSANGQPSTSVATIAPSVNNWGVFIGSSGDIHIGINTPGIAVRVEVPREFSAGIRAENDTSFIQSDIRNDYYYYNVVDESRHWSYAWNGTDSDGPCFKPDATFYDPNAPWCVEIWNYLNGSFRNFSTPKNVELTLQAPHVAGIYNFTVFVASKNDSLGRPDFVHAWNTTLYVPVTMRDNPANITATILDCPYNYLNGIPIKAKGIAYALNNGQVVARAYVNETTGTFTLTGLDPSIKQYDVQASAGIFREPDGTPVAFSLTDMGQIGINTISPGTCLARAPQIWGHVEYRFSTGSQQDVPNAVTAHPWLTTLFPSLSTRAKLNITVEALDALGTHMYRNFTVSQNSSSDSFRIITGAGWKYGGVSSIGTPDPYGTEFAGLPQNAQFSVYAWVAGYYMQNVQSVTVTPPGVGLTLNTGSPSNVEVVMLTGAALSGDLKFDFCNGPCTSGAQLFKDETPIQAENRIVNTNTELVYGGNIVIEAFDNTNTLRGISVLNETYPNGTVRFWNSTNVPFTIFGFSEYFNRSLTMGGAYSVASGNNPAQIPLCTQPRPGSFCWKDAALPQGTYTFKVYVSGYELIPGSPPVTAAPSILTPISVPIRMIEGGTVEVLVSSYDNRPGSTALQAMLPWRFLNLAIPVRARVYYYDLQGNTLGYVERLMVSGAQNGVQKMTFKTAFAGQNWSVRDILFFGETPDYVPSGNASVSVFTLGYIQRFPGKILASPTTLGQLTTATVAMLYGNEIDLTTPLFNDPSIFTTVPEHQHIIAEAGSSLGLAGAVTENLTAGFPLTLSSSPLDFPIYGLGGMVYDNLTAQAKSFVGQGHFFYVPRDGLVNPRCVNYGFLVSDANHCFDYGLGNSTFWVNVPEYGFERHFTELNTTSPIVSFDGLYLEQGAGIFLINMAKVTQNGAVVGERCDSSLMPLSWVQVIAQATGQPLQVTTTYDGNYSLFLRGGSLYSLTFALLTFYPPQPSPPLLVGNPGWGSTTPVTPLPLIPMGGPTCGSSQQSSPSKSLVKASSGVYQLFQKVEEWKPRSLEMASIAIVPIFNTEHQVCEGTA